MGKKSKDVKLLDKASGMPGLPVGSRVVMQPTKVTTVAPPNVSREEQAWLHDLEDEMRRAKEKTAAGFSEERRQPMVFSESEDRALLDRLAFDKKWEEDQATRARQKARGILPQSRPVAPTMRPQEGPREVWGEPLNISPRAPLTDEQLLSRRDALFNMRQGSDEMRRNAGANLTETEVDLLRDLLRRSRGMK